MIIDTDAGLRDMVVNTYCNCIAIHRQRVVLHVAMDNSDAGNCSNTHARLIGILVWVGHRIVGNSREFGAEVLYNIAYANNAPSLHLKALNPHIELGHGAVMMNSEALAYRGRSVFHSFTSRGLGGTMVHGVVWYQAGASAAGSPALLVAELGLGRRLRNVCSWCSAFMLARHAQALRSIFAQAAISARYVAKQVPGRRRLQRVRASRRGASHLAHLCGVNAVRGTPG